MKITTFLSLAIVITFANARLSPSNSSSHIDKRTLMPVSSTPRSILDDIMDQSIVACYVMLQAALKLIDDLDDRTLFLIFGADDD